MSDNYQTVNGFRVIRNSDKTYKKMHEKTKTYLKQAGIKIKQSLNKYILKKCSALSSILKKDKKTPNMEKQIRKLNEVKLDAAKLKAAYDMGTIIIKKQREKLRALEEMHDKNYQDLIKVNDAVRTIQDEINRLNQVNNTI